MSINKTIKRGEIYYAKLNGIGNQQIGTRPVIIYSNNINNKFSPIINVIPLSTELKDLCVHVKIEGCGLKAPSMAMAEQITTINKDQLLNKIGKLKSLQLDMLDEAIDIQFARDIYRKDSKVVA